MPRIHPKTLPRFQESIERWSVLADIKHENAEILTAAYGKRSSLVGPRSIAREFHKHDIRHCDPLGASNSKG